MKSFVINFLLFIFTNFCAIATTIPHYPQNGSYESSDFYFICKCDNDAELTLEISNDDTFENIIFRNSSRWLNLDGWKQLPMSPSELGNGTYYWRVYDNTDYTKIMRFTIYGQDEISTNYKIKHDDNEYIPQKISGYDAPLVLSSLWIRSENTENGLCQPEKGGNNHSMIVIGDTIYISYCDAINNNPHINRINAKTGESIDSIHINYGSYSKPNKALCDLNTNGSIVYTTNCGSTMSSNKSDLYIDILELTSLEAKVVGRYTCKLPSYSSLGMPYEVLYSKAIGDIESGNFTLYSALNGLTTTNSPLIAVYKWTFSNGANVCEAPTSSFRFTSTSTGTRTRIYPIDLEKDYYIIDNEVIHPTIYKSRTSKKDFSVETSFNASTDYKGNGIHIFKHGVIPMMIYAPYFKTGGSKFELTALPTTFFDGSSSQTDTFKGIKSLWQFPTTNLGSVTPIVNATLAASTTDMSTNGYPHTRIFIYSAGNGLAAYQLSHYKTTSAESEITDAGLTYNIIDSTIKFSKTFNNIHIYNATGSLLAFSTQSSKIDISNLPKGIYFVTADNHSFKIYI